MTTLLWDASGLGKRYAPEPGSEMAEALLLSSQRVKPALLVRLGYRFSRPLLEPTLREIVAGRS